MIMGGGPKSGGGGPTTTTSRVEPVIPPFLRRHMENVLGEQESLFRRRSGRLPRERTPAPQGTEINRNILDRLRV